ncbi:MAG: hypothetical protein WCI11_18040, partial [Candidatus Methylumidiphilus sp.]
WRSNPNPGQSKLWRSNPNPGQSKLWRSNPNLGQSKLWRSLRNISELIGPFSTGGHSACLTLPVRRDSWVTIIRRGTQSAWMLSP